MPDLCATKIPNLSLDQHMASLSSSRLGAAVETVELLLLSGPMAVLGELCYCRERTFHHTRIRCYKDSHLPRCTRPKEVGTPAFSAFAPARCCSWPGPPASNSRPQLVVK